MREVISSSTLSREIPMGSKQFIPGKTGGFFEIEVYSLLPSDSSLGSLVITRKARLSELCHSRASENVIPRDRFPSTHWASTQQWSPSAEPNYRKASLSDLWHLAISPCPISGRVTLGLRL